jgi:ribonuclease Z
MMQQLHPSEVVGPTKIGRKLVILGDTCDSSGIAKIGQGADLLIHECTLPRRLATEARKRGHSTASTGQPFLAHLTPLWPLLTYDTRHNTWWWIAAMAGKFAKRIQAKKLILTHFSARTTVAHEVPLPHSSFIYVCAFYLTNQLYRRASRTW